MDIREVRKILDPQFGYWAKSTGELLYVHHYIAWSIFKKLSKYIPSLNEKEKYILEIACLIHDIGKMKEEIQEALKKGKKLALPHKITSEEEIVLYLKKANLNTNLNKNDIKRITDIIRTHHGVSEKDLTEIATSGAGFYTLILSTCDYLTSMDRISYSTITKLKNIYKGKLEFTTVEYSRFSSPTTYVIVRKIVEAYKNEGWEPICFPENGIVWVGKPNTKLPQKDKIVKEIVEEIIKESLLIQDPIPRHYTGDHLTLLSKEFPELFLEIHKSKIIDTLGNIDQKSIVFFKLLRDVLSSQGFITSDLKKKKPVLDMIDGANSRSRHPKVKEKYRELYKKEPPEKVNTDFFVPIFENAKLEDVIPDNITISASLEKKLKNLYPDELFSILIAIARSKGSSVRQKLEEYIDTSISMEEEIDFRVVASKIFEKYKEYKRTSSAEKGCCERCGCPIAFKMQPALNLTRAPQAFSQIKPKYAYRSICPFCGYDNLVLRKEAKSKRIRILLRLETKMPDLFINIDELDRLISVIWSGIRNPQGIIKLKEREELKDLPFSERIEIPVTKNEKMGKSQILVAENGILFHLEDIADKDFSLKDIKAKYEPLYHAMKFLGFKVAIGNEEQDKLFGEDIESTEGNYYKSLATILLANLIEKKIKNKKRRYIFARSLLEKAPSVAITIIGDSVSEKKVTMDLIKCLIKLMINTKIIIARKKEVKI